MRVDIQASDFKDVIVHVQLTMTFEKLKLLEAQLIPGTWPSHQVKQIVGTAIRDLTTRTSAWVETKKVDA